MKKNEKGFSVVEILIVLVVVGLIGGTGWYVWQPKHKTTENNKSTTNSTPATEQKATDNPEVKSEVNYLTIKEWGVKISLRDTDKVSYAYTSQPNGSYYGSSYDSTIDVELKAGQEPPAGCSSKVGALLRSKDKPQPTDVNGHPSISNFKQIGSYYYFVPGGDPACSNNQAHEELQKRIREDLLNITQL